MFHMDPEKHSHGKKDFIDLKIIPIVLMFQGNRCNLKSIQLRYNDLFRSEQFEISKIK